MNHGTEHLAAGFTVWNRGKTLSGKTTGAYCACRLDGCAGRRLSVRWSDGARTRPCTKGMDYDEATKEWTLH